MAEAKDNNPRLVPRDAPSHGMAHPSTPPPREHKEPEAEAAHHRGPAMKLWRLTPTDAQEPPFHFTGTPQTLVVAAEDEDRARLIASLDAQGGEAWASHDLVKCEELRPEVAGIVARDLSA